MALLKSNDHEEFLSYFPEWKFLFDAVQEILKSYTEEMLAEVKIFKDKKDTMPRRDLVALISKEAKWQDYVFKQLWGKYSQEPMEYLWGMLGDNLLNKVKQEPKLVDVIKD